MSKPTVLYFEINNIKLRAICRVPSASGKELVEWQSTSFGLAQKVHSLDLERFTAHGLGDEIWTPLNSNDLLSIPPGVITAIMAQELARIGEGRTLTLAPITLESSREAAKRMGLQGPVALGCSDLGLGLDPV